MPVDPLTIGAAASLISPIYKSIVGARQQREARRAMRNLREPDMTIPASIKQLAQEPVAEEFRAAQMDAIDLGASQSLEALQDAGPQAALGGALGVQSARNRQVRDFTAGINQMRNDALSQLGQAELDLQRRKQQNYLQKLAAAQQSLMAGEQNIATGLDFASGIGQQAISLGLRKSLGMNAEPFKE